MKKVLSLLCGVMMLFGVAYNVQALSIVPSDAELWGDETGNSDILVTISETYSIGDVLYKQDVGGSEEGLFGSSYETVFSNTASEPSDATITYVGPNSINANPVYLLVKDGDHSPAWYFFDITGWNGTETIAINNFWTGGGAISYVAIYGTKSVPEPGTLLLLGSGLLGLGLMRRRKYSA